MNNLDRQTLDHLTTFLDDRDAPPQPRAAVTEALDRYRAAIDHQAAHRLAHLTLTEDIASHRRSAPATIVDRLGTGTASLDDLTAGLAELLARQEQMREQSLWLDRAESLCAQRVRACLADHLAVLVPYIASHRARLPLTHEVPPYVAHVWRCISSRVRVWFPPEACLVEDELGTRSLPSVESLTLGRNERHRWAWAAIYLGQSEALDRNGLLTFRVAADWDDRTELLDMVTDPSAVTAPPTSLARTLGVARARRRT